LVTDTVLSVKNSKLHIADESMVELPIGTIESLPLGNDAPSQLRRGIVQDNDIHRIDTRHPDEPGSQAHLFFKALPRIGVEVPV
jgi:hypothetical protein